MRSDGSAKQFERELRDVRYELLDEAAEDSIGLWEVPMTVRKLFPELASDQQAAIARQVVRELLGEDLIAFYRRRDATPSERMEAEEVASRLEQDTWWQVPQTADPHKNWYEIDWLWLATTDRGQEERDRQARMRFAPGGSDAASPS